MDVLSEGSEYLKLNGHHLFIAKRTGNGGYGRYDQTCRVEFT